MLLLNNTSFLILMSLLSFSLFIQEDAATLQTTMITFLRTRAQDRDVVHEVGGQILSGLSNTLNASSDITAHSYGQLTVQQEDTDLAKGFRRRAIQQNTVTKGFFRVNNEVFSSFVLMFLFVYRSSVLLSVSLSVDIFVCLVLRSFLSLLV